MSQNEGFLSNLLLLGFPCLSSLNSKRTGKCPFTKHLSADQGNIFLKFNTIVFM